MGQHIIGAILFGLIVGIAIFVSEFFVTLPTPLPVYDPSKNLEKPGNWGNCNKKKIVEQPKSSGKFSIHIVQSVLSLTERQLKTKYLIRREKSQTENIDFLLHFFVKDGAKTQFTLSESVTVKPEFDHQGKATLTVTSYAYPVITKNETLYLIAEPNVNFRTSRIPYMKFNPTKATPVLLDIGK